MFSDTFPAWPLPRSCLLKRITKLQEGLDRFSAADKLSNLQSMSFGFQKIIEP
jgi:hypothetical protein